MMRFSPAYASTTRRWKRGAITSSFLARRKIAGTRLVRAFVPHPGFGRDPAVRAIGVAIKAQHVNFRLTALMSQSRPRGPHFQLAVLEWNPFTRRRARVDPITRRKQNQSIWQRCERNHG